jgi:hypothetical protein
MVQRSPLCEDVRATVRALEGIALDGPGLDLVAAEVAKTSSRLVVTDIAPLGIAVAQRLSLPSVLIENFTWDWIYRSYREAGLDLYAERCARLVAAATLHIQTEPVCGISGRASIVPPVSRSPRSPARSVRRSLGIAAGQSLVLLSWAGSSDLVRQDRIRTLCPGVVWAMPAAVSRIVHDRGIVRFPSLGGPFHPDLVAAADLVIAKLGYSTVAEAYHGRTALAYLCRPAFPESPVLERFVRCHIPSAAITPSLLDDPSAAKTITRLVDAARPPGRRANGAEAAARLVADLLRRG